MGTLQGKSPPSYHLPTPPNTLDTPPEELAPEESSNPAYAVVRGYAESRRDLVHSTAEQTPLDSLVARLGQICGGADGT